jgi:adenosylhomocysteine nucleosidase
MDGLDDVLVVMAIAAEGQGRFDALGERVLFTGIGKINATHRLTKRLSELQLVGRAPRRVVNFGTAGSPVFETGVVVGCRQFIQADMDARGLGFELGQTPFEDGPATLTFPPTFTELPEGVCGSADRFDTGGEGPRREVIDMEAYALAKVCQLEGLAFACAKYITDGADHNAAADWRAALPLAAARFRELYDELYQSG